MRRPLACHLACHLAWTRAGLAAAALTLLGVGCGGGQTRPDLFSTNWSDDQGRSIAAVQKRLAAARPTPGTDVAVGVTAQLDTIVGLPLDGGAPWKFAHPLTSRPLVATSVVVATGAGEVFALDAATGRKLWARPAGGLLHGAGDDGGVTVVTMSSAAGAGGSTLLAVARDGSVVRQIETDQNLGTPAVVDRLAFVPWASQYVSVLDLADGGEIARVVLREMTSRAWTTAGALYFGEVGLFRFDDHIKDAARNEATHLTLPARELPGSPKLMPPGDLRLAPTPNAPDKIRLYARPAATTAPLGWSDDRFYATYFKLIMGFTSGKGSLAWVHLQANDIIGGAAADGGVVLCDATGKVTVLAAKSGGLVSEKDLGGPLASCVVQADGFKPGAVIQDNGPIAAQLQLALQNGDLELATAQRLLLRELSTTTDEQATATFVALASDPRTSPALLGDARSQLAARRNGASFMIAALGRHYDFLKDVLRPPPVAPLAQALAAMNEKAAAPALAAHLLDPADTDDDVKQAALALVALATPAEVPTLKQYFAMYRDAPEDPPEVADAVVSVGQALMKVGGAEGRAIVDQALRHPLTNPVVKAKLQAILEAQDAQKAPGQAGAPASPVVKP